MKLKPVTQTEQVENASKELLTEMGKEIVPTPATSDNGVSPALPKERTLAEVSQSRCYEFFTSLDREDPKQMEYFIRAFQAADYHAQDRIGQWFPVEHVLYQMCELTNPETGEIEHSTRTAMIGHNGEITDSWADGVVRGFQTFALVGLVPPFPPGFQLRIVQVKGKGANRTYVLEKRVIMPSELT